MSAAAAKLAVTFLLCAAPAAAAEFVVTIAEIAGGRLTVAGSSPGPNQTVTLDTAFSTTSDATRSFSFNLDSHFPSDCIVDLKAGAKRATAPVDHCAAQGIVPRGAWRPARSYEAGDLVAHKGSSWQARSGNSGVQPGTSNAVWQKFAAGGADGTRGPKGLDGPQGAEGNEGVKGAKGPDGPQGDPGSVGEAGDQGPEGLEVTIAFPEGAGDHSASVDFSFIGEPAQGIAVAEGQRLTAEVTAPVRLTEPPVVPQVVVFSICYSLDGGNSVELDPGSGLTVEFTDNPNPAPYYPLALAATSGPLAAGTYDVDTCFKSLTDPDPSELRVAGRHGWIRVTN